MSYYHTVTRRNRTANGFIDCARVFSLPSCGAMMLIESDDYHNTLYTAFSRADAYEKIHITFHAVDIPLGCFSWKTLE